MVVFDSPIEENPPEVNAVEVIDTLQTNSQQLYEELRQLDLVPTVEQFQRELAAVPEPQRQQWIVRRVFNMTLSILQGTSNAAIMVFRVLTGGLPSMIVNMIMGPLQPIFNVAGVVNMILSSPLGTAINAYTDPNQWSWSKLFYVMTVNTGFGVYTQMRNMWAGLLDNIAQTTFNISQNSRGALVLSLVDAVSSSLAKVLPIGNIQLLGQIMVDGFLKAMDDLKLDYPRTTVSDREFSATIFGVMFMYYTYCIVHSLSQVGMVMYSNRRERRALELERQQNLTRMTRSQLQNVQNQLRQAIENANEELEQIVVILQNRDLMEQVPLEQ